MNRTLLAATALLVGAIALPTQASAQSSTYCWTCQEFQGCVLSNGELVGSDRCETQYTEPQGCWEWGTCYPWVGGLPAFMDEESMTSDREDGEWKIAWTCDETLVDFEAMAGSDHAPPANGAPRVTAVGPAQP